MGVPGRRRRGRVLRRLDLVSSYASLMKPVGPKAEAFVWDKRLITGIMGPVGSAKTTTCIRKAIHAALWQNPGPDGVYRAKGGVIRDTYPQLKKTALASWFTWFPKTLGDWNGEAPYEHTVRFRVLAGEPFIAGPQRFVTIELTMIFAAIGENKVEDVMRGWELTFLWLNEGDLVARDVFTIGIGRVGRYPSMLQGGCKWRGIFLDMNAPDVENWTYELFVDQDLGLDAETMAELKEELGELFGIGFYVQPGGRSKAPLPENIENLPKGYYAQQILGMGRDAHKIRRMVDNEFGPVRRGQPVFTEYEEKTHVAAEKLRPIKDVPLRIAADAGLTPAAVIGQRDHRGQIRVLGEVVTFGNGDNEQLEQLGATAFGRMVGRYVKDEFPDNDVSEIVWCDPAATAGEGARGADPSWRQNFTKGLREELGERIRVKPAPVKGNRLEERLEAVRKPMRTIVEGGEPAFIICPVRCKILRRGFKGMYIYARSKLANDMGRFNNEPLKNDFSHVQDANQYLCCGLTKQGNGDDLGRGQAHPGTRMDRGDRERRQAVTVDNNYNRFSGR
jgi:hypothetical protein